MPGGSTYTGSFDFEGGAYDNNVYGNTVNLIVTDVTDSNKKRILGAEKTCSTSDSDTLGRVYCKYVPTGLNAGRSYSITSLPSNNGWGSSSIYLSRGIIGGGSSGIIYKNCGSGSCSLSTSSLPTLTQGETYIITFLFRK